METGDFCGKNPRTGSQTKRSTGGGGINYREAGETTDGRTRQRRGILRRDRSSFIRGEVEPLRFSPLEGEDERGHSDLLPWLTWKKKGQRLV